MYIFLYQLADKLVLEFTWVIGSKPDCHPSTGGHADGVSFNGINEVESGWVCSRVEVPGALADDEEVESVKM